MKYDFWISAFSFDFLRYCYYLIAKSKRVQCLQLTTAWLKWKIRKLFSRKKVTKVAFADMQKFVRNCSDSSVKKEYQLAISEGIQYIMLAVDENNKMIGSPIYIMDFLKYNYEIEDMLGKERMLVVEG